VGTFFSFLASQLWPTFFDARSVRDATGLPVLGSVSMLIGDRQRRRERNGLIGFATGVLALVGSYGASLLAILLLSARAA